MMTEMVKVRNLSFSYDENLVLKDIKLNLEKGDFVAFVGPNGSGKSTLVKLMIGELVPDRGEISILGTDIKAFRDWSRIAYMSQQVRGFNHSFPATVKEIIAANLYQKMGFFKILNKKLEEKIDSVLELVGLENYKNRQIGSLSGGQQQKVFIARTLVNDPELIFLDEPMVGIDRASQDDFIDLINRLNKVLKICIVMVSHDIHVISKQANKIACFNNQNVFLHDSDDFEAELLYGEISSQKRIIPEHQHINGGDSNA